MGPAIRSRGRGPCLEILSGRIPQDNRAASGSGPNHQKSSPDASFGTTSSFPKIGGKCPVADPVPAPVPAPAPAPVQAHDDGQWQKF